MSEEKVEETKATEEEKPVEAVEKPPEEKPEEKPPEKPVEKKGFLAKLKGIFRREK